MLLKLNDHLFIETKAITHIDLAAVCARGNDTVLRAQVSLVNGSVFGFKQDSAEAGILKTYIEGTTGGHVPTAEHLSPAGLAEYERTSQLPTRTMVKA